MRGSLGLRDSPAYRSVQPFFTAQHTDSHTNKYTERQTTLHRGIGSNRPHLAVAAMLLHAKNKYNNNNSDSKYGYSQKAL